MISTLGFANAPSCDGLVNGACGFYRGHCAVKVTDTHPLPSCFFLTLALPGMLTLTLTPLCTAPIFYCITHVLCFLGNNDHFLRYFCERCNVTTKFFMLHESATVCSLFLKNSVELAMDALYPDASNFRDVWVILS